METFYHPSYAAKVQTVKPGQPTFIRTRRREENRHNEPCDRIQASALLHAIDNLLCCIRLHASALSASPEARQIANEILVASRQLETNVNQLASLVR